MQTYYGFDDASRKQRFWDFINHLSELGLKQHLPRVYTGVTCQYDGPNSSPFNVWLDYHMTQDPNFLRKVLKAFEFGQCHPVLVSAMKANPEFYPLFSQQLWLENANDAYNRRITDVT